MTTVELTAADHIRELTQGFTTAAHAPNWAPTPTTNPGPYHQDTRNGWVLLPGTRIHTVRNPGLLDQLRQTVTGTTMTADGTYTAAYGSKPAGRLDVLAFLHRIDHQSRQLAIDLGFETPDRTRTPGTHLPLTERLHRIAGALPDKPHPTVRSWWATARVLTQHDGPPFSPRVPCPIETCETHGGLRVRVEERLAICVECHHVWADDNPHHEATFGRLAVWIRWASEHLSGLRHWVPATHDNSGYDQAFGYQIECPECAPERRAIATRRAAALTKARRNRAAA